jgi:hypothetical protein
MDEAEDITAQVADEIRREQAKDADREDRLLSDLAYTFLIANNGDKAKAEEAFETMITLLCEADTVLLLWKYRRTIALIREGL